MIKFTWQTEIHSRNLWVDFRNKVSTSNIPNIPPKLEETQIFLFVSEQIWPINMRCDLADWLQRLTANVKIATVLGSIPASSDTVDSEGRQKKQDWKKYF